MHAAARSRLLLLLLFLVKLSHTVVLHFLLHVSSYNVATCTIEFVCFHVHVLHISAVFCHILGWLMIPDQNGFYVYARVNA